MKSTRDLFVANTGGTIERAAGVRVHLIISVPPSRKRPGQVLSTDDPMAASWTVVAAAIA